MEKSQQKPQQKSVYEICKENDYAGLFNNAIGEKRYRVTEDWQIEANRMPATDSPWHHIKRKPGYDCERWHNYMTNIVMRKPNINFIPIRCQNCWKVVARPRTLKELFQLEILMVQWDRHSKLGIEPRVTVNGLYGAYFYNESLREGLDCYKFVREQIDKAFDKEMSVILKRGCTEYELTYGDSKNYKVHPWQKKHEQVISKLVVPDFSDSLQPDWVVNHVHVKWIEYAYANGDQTYLEFTGGKRLYPELRTYHHLVDASPEEIEKFWHED